MKMTKKILSIVLTLSVLLVPQFAVASQVDNTSEVNSAGAQVFDFKNVYEYDSVSYKEKAEFEDLKVTLNAGLLDMNLDGLNLKGAAYDTTTNAETGTTLISASGQIDDNSYASLRLVYDKKENANGNIILTTTKEVNVDGEIKVIETDKLIRFAPVKEAISLESLVNGIKSNQNYQESYNPSGPSGIQALAASELPVVKSYKYSNYTYGGVFWNTSYIATGNSPMQLKFSPSIGNLYFWKDPYGRQGTIIKNQSLIISTSANYSFTSGPIGFTYPIVDNPNNPRNVTIKISYKGLGLGVSFPLGSDNSITNGSNAKWTLKKQYTDFLDRNGNDLDAYYLEGTTTITGAGQTTTVATSATVKIGAVYYFGDIPAQDVVFTDNITIPSFSASVKSE